MFDEQKITETQKLYTERRKGFNSGLICGIICTIFIVLAGLGGQYLYDTIVLKAVVVDDNQYNSVINKRSINKIEAMEEIIQTRFYQVENITNEELEEGLYRGLISALNDPYADYFSKDELIMAHASIEGVFYGIGALISYDEEKNLAVISGILEGGSAAESDLREGDYIIMVDDVDVTAYSSAEVVSLVRGQENTKVMLTIYREGVSDYITFDLIRKKALEKATVRSGFTEDANIGYIRIYEFDNITINQFNDALDELMENGIRGLIIDLRSNPGGNINSVNAIARRILPEGLIVYTEDRQGKRVEYTCDGKNELMIPLTVLVDQATASAAEILAGAIQDYQKGTVIGQQTFGKGIVQQIVNMSDNTAVKLTVSSYYTPLGRSLNGTGVTPDIIVELNHSAYYEDDIDTQFEEAMRVLKDKIY